MKAFRLPIHSVLFRGETPYLYAVEEHSSDLKLLFWDMGQAADYRAVQVPLPRYIEQEEDLIVPDLDPAHRRVVIRGQHRLVQGRRVRIVQQDTTTNRPGDAFPDPSERGGTAGPRQAGPTQETATLRSQQGASES